MADPHVFWIEEYKALRAEIDYYIAELRSQERYAVIAAGFVWSWLITNGRREVFLWSAPVLLMVAIVVRSYGMSEHIKVISRHIKRIEQNFDVKGWEHQYHSGALGFTTLTLSYALLALSLVGLIFHSSLIYNK